MATSNLKPDKKPRVLPAGVGPRTLVRWFSLIRFLAATVEGFKLSTDGLDPMEFPGGMHLRGGAGSGSGEDFPWKVTLASSDGGLVAHVIGGTYNGIPVEDTDVPLTGTGIEYICLFPIHELLINNSYVYDETFDSITIDTNDAGGRIDSADGTGFALPIARIEDGVLTNQYLNAVVTYRIIDNSGDGTTTQGRILYFGASSS